MINNHFINDKESRGQIIHACGTGKTLTSYYAYQELKPKLAIYLVPSLQLITQTLNEWSKESLGIELDFDKHYSYDELAGMKIGKFAVTKYS